MQPDLHGVGGRLEQIGALFGRQPLDIPQEQHGAIGLRQPIDRLPHELGRFPARRGFVGRLGPRDEPLDVVVHQRPHELELAREWLGRDLPAEAAVPELITRYLRAFGPSTLADVQAWSRLTGLKAHAAGLDLVRYRNEDGKELLDVPDGVIVSEDVPAPARLLPAFDNVLLGHADRSRIMSEDARSRWGAVRNGVFPPTFLVDGFLHGTWNVVETKDVATLTIEPYFKTAKKELAGVIREAQAVLKVMAPKKEHVIAAP